MPSAHRIGILSDTHGRLDPRILEWLAECAVIVHAGDVGSSSVLEALASTGARVVAVRGNNDVASKWPPPRAPLHALADEQRLDLPGGALIVVHGHRVLPASRRHERLRERYPDVRAVVFGHSHRLVIDRSARPWVLNPGAAGRARTFGGPSAFILRASTSRWTIRSRRFES